MIKMILKSFRGQSSMKGGKKQDEGLGNGNICEPDYSRNERRMYYFVNNEYTMTKIY